LPASNKLVSLLRRFGLFLANKGTALTSIPGQIGKRTTDLQDIWKPVGLVLSLISAFKGVWQFQHATGPFLIPSALLLVVAVAILFTLPIKSIRLLARRLMAFAVDLAFLCLLTVAIVGLLFKSQALRASAVLSMAIVWTWFLLLVLCEWRFMATPGQQILGLRLRRAGTEGITLVNCVGRNLLILVVPLVVAGPILTGLRVSRAGFLAQSSIGLALLFLFPLAIAFFGGQSIPDLLLGTTLLPATSDAKDYPGRPTRHAWLFLAVASLLIGTIFAFALSTTKHIVEERKPPMLPFDQIQTSGELEAGIAARLRSYIEADMNPDYYLQDLRVSSVLGELPSKTREASMAEACSKSFESKKGYQIVRAQIGPGAPTLLDALLFSGFVSMPSAYFKRPTIVVLEVASRESFGVFNIERFEDYVFCLTDSNGQAANSLVDLSAGLRVPVSIQEPALLLLGQLETYSQIEKVPVWPQ